MRLENGRKLAAHFSNGNVNKKGEEEEERRNVVFMYMMGLKKQICAFIYGVMGP